MITGRISKLKFEVNNFPAQNTLNEVSGKVHS